MEFLKGVPDPVCMSALKTYLNTLQLTTRIVRFKFGTEYIVKTNSV